VKKIPAQLIVLLAVNGVSIKLSLCHSLVRSVHYSAFSVYIHN